MMHFEVEFEVRIESASTSWRRMELTLGRAAEKAVLGRNRSLRRVVAAAQWLSNCHVPERDTWLQPSRRGVTRRAVQTELAAIIGAMRTLQEMDGHGGVAALGDWHGNTHYAVRVIRHLASRGVRRFVHTGDFAYDFRPGFLRAVEAELKRFDADLAFVPGNHEDYDYLESVPIDDDGTGRISERITYLPRGLRWNWDSRTWMGLGGAASIDRVHRKQSAPGKQWWPQELITAVDVQTATAGGHVDVLITHDAPSSVHLELPPFSWIPPEDEAAAIEQRSTLERVVESVTPEVLVHGHHHRYQIARALTGSGHEYLAVSLDCDGSPFDWNSHLVA
ncbi:Calcineurin-like phosphoesterase superfamily domain [Mycobacteroides abscessus]|nr:Calcineurin-like phosphoesterase superfamily domain [Mycobacteroides abscessus]CPU85862.1 Calcineurin-like phosphoesterase superfamily domain [Mycobacteroides abscessus]